MLESIHVESTPVEATAPRDLESLVSGFKALGDPTRLSILAVLSSGTRCVCEIQAVVDVPGNLLSHHLKVLRDAGLIEGERRGRWVDYTLNTPAVGALRASLPPDPAQLGIDPAASEGACARDEA